MFILLTVVSPVILSSNFLIWMWRRECQRLSDKPTVTYCNSSCLPFSPGSGTDLLAHISTALYVHPLEKIWVLIHLHITSSLSHWSNFGRPLYQLTRRECHSAPGLAHEDGSLAATLRLLRQEGRHVVLLDNQTGPHD